MQPSIKFPTVEESITQAFETAAKDVALIPDVVSQALARTVKLDSSAIIREALEKAKRLS